MPFGPSTPSPLSQSNKEKHPTLVWKHTPHLRA